MDRKSRYSDRMLPHRRDEKKPLEKHNRHGYCCLRAGAKVVCQLVPGHHLQMTPRVPRPILTVEVIFLHSVTMHIQQSARMPPNPVGPHLTAKVRMRVAEVSQEGLQGASPF